MRLSTTLSCLGLLLASLLLGLPGCPGPQTVALEPSDAEGAQQPAPLPGQPAVLELETDQAHLVRLTEAETMIESGRLEIASTEPGVTVTIDGGQERPVPLLIEVSAGPHTINASCPDTSTETFSVIIDASATVQVQVCQDQP